MIKHYLLGTMRQFARQKFYAAITILGLAIGLACFLVTSSWIRFETGFDTGWANGERIARIIGDQQFATGEHLLVPLPFNLAPILAQEFPEIEQVARIQSPASLLFAVGNKRYYESSVFYADSNILEIFALPLLNGDPRSALNGPDRAILSSETSEKYFGSDDPVGKTIRLDNRVDLTVAGVLAPLRYSCLSLPV